MSAAHQTHHVTSGNRVNEDSSKSITEINSSSCSDVTKFFYEILDEVMMDVCFDVHWSHRTGITASNLKIDGSGKPDNDSFKTSSSGSNPLVQCPVCRQTIGAVRFAPHLEKCINGGHRVSAKRSRSGMSGVSVEKDIIAQLLTDGADPALFTKGGVGARAGRSVSARPGASRETKRKYVYGSLVVRIKFGKDGLPLPGSKRDTVSFSTFHYRQQDREAREKALAESNALALTPDSLLNVNSTNLTNGFPIVQESEVATGVDQTVGVCSSRSPSLMKSPARPKGRPPKAKIKECDILENDSESNSKQNSNNKKLRNSNN